MNILRSAGWLSILLSSQTMAQTPYPGTPAPLSNLVQAEYFFDADPGFGNGTFLIIPVVKDINEISKIILVNGTGLTNGFHRLYFRTLNGEGHWSLTENILFNNLLIPDYTNNVSAATIIAAEYFLDLDPGIGNATPLAIAGGQDLNNLSVAINLTSVASGPHTLYIRTKDNEGRWSLTNISVFDNSNPALYPSGPGALPALQQGEYFIDTDPGFGLANPVNFPVGADVQGFNLNIPVNGLAQGIHRLYLRSVSTPWGLTTVSEFLVGSILPLHWLFVKGQLEKEGCRLYWRTADEENTASFQVEQSTDGVVFRTIGELPAKGITGPIFNDYTFYHPDIMPGANYYRIKQVDKDGRFSYSSMILMVSNKDLKEIIIGPNPTYGQLSIIQPASAFLEGYAVHTTSGTVVLQQTVQILKERIWSLNLTGLPPGEYVLTLFYKQSKNSFRVLKR